MWRSSWRRVSSFLLKVSSFFLSMIATLRLLPFDAGRQEKVAPHRTLSRVKSNKYRKRERQRASTGGDDGRGQTSRFDISRKSRLVRSLTKRGRLRKAIRNAEGTGLFGFHRERRVYRTGRTKKRPLSGPPFFKEAKWRESEETSLTPLWGTETDRVRCRDHRE